MLLNVVFSDGAAFTTQSRSSLRSYANSFIIVERYLYRSIKSSKVVCVACQWTTALCIKRRSIWKHVMEIYYWLQNRRYWRDAHRIRLIVQPCAAWASTYSSISSCVPYCTNISERVQKVWERRWEEEEDRRDRTEVCEMMKDDNAGMHGYCAQKYNHLLSADLLQFHRSTDQLAWFACRFSRSKQRKLLKKDNRLAVLLLFEQNI